MPDLAESGGGVFMTMGDGGDDGDGAGLTLPEGASGAVMMTMSSMQGGDGSPAIVGGTVNSAAIPTAT